MTLNPRPRLMRSFFTLLLVLSFLFSLGSIVCSVSEADPSNSAVEEPAKEAPAAGGLADMVSTMASLRERSKNDEKKLSTLFNLSSATRELEERRTMIEELAAQLEALKRNKNYGFDQLIEFRGRLRDQGRALQDLTGKLSDALGQAGQMQSEWTQDKLEWKQWQKSFIEHGRDPALAPMLSEAGKTIDRMLDLVSDALKPILAFQEKTEALTTKFQSVSDEADGLLRSLREEIFRKSAPSMFSSSYYTKWNRGVWKELGKGIGSVQWYDRAFFMAQGWVAVLQLIFSLILIGGIFRYRMLLQESKQWRFLLMRPISAGMFVGLSALSPLYNQVPSGFQLLLWGIVSLSVARLVGSFITLGWKRWLLYLLAFLFFAIHLFRVLGLPQPIFRLYVTLVAFGGVPLCLWRANAAVRRRDSRIYIGSLRLGAGILGVVFIAQIGGYNALATHLLQSTIMTTFLVLLAWMLAYMVRGGLEFAIEHTLLQNLHLIRRNKHNLLRRSGLLIDIVIGMVAFFVILGVWKIFGTPMEAVDRVFSFGFVVGKQKFTIGHFVAAAAVLYGSFAISWTLQSVLIHDVFPHSQVGHGTGVSIVRLVHYALILIGILLALGALGFELKNLIILTGALGVGIGFGLQNIANNFVSGLILLFERPIKVGDIIMLNGEWAEVRKLGLRATVVQTLDRSEIIVPNSDLISNQVINYTFSDKMVRVVVPVGVAYGSDVPLVMRLLWETAAAHPRVLSEPKPQVLFLSFGESSLDFQLRAWIEDVNHLIATKSELHQEVDRRFRENGVEISFPQRDLHVRSVDRPVIEDVLGASARRQKSDNSSPAE